MTRSDFRIISSERKFAKNRFVWNAYFAYEARVLQSYTLYIRVSIDVYSERFSVDIERPEQLIYRQ